MGRHKRRMKGIDKNNQDEHEEALTLRQKATRFAFLVLYTGVGYSIACLLFLFNDIVPPSKQQNKGQQNSPKLFKQISNPLSGQKIPGPPRTKTTSSNDSDSLDLSIGDQPIVNEAPSKALQLPKNAGRTNNGFQFRPITTPPTSTTTTTQGGSSFDDTIGDD